MLLKFKNKILQIIQLVFNYFKIKKTNRFLKQYHNIHFGKRCFIVGNGPSLRVEDLNKLHNEVCFGTHRIYNIFGHTDWRPTYYCAQDSTLIYESAKDIENLYVNEKFIAINRNWKYHKIKDAIYINLITNQFYPNLPEFSTDITKGIFEGFTVSYMCLQIAIYMGFKEIYLVGIDHKYSQTLMPDGKIEINDSLKDHFSNEDTLANIPQLYKSVLSYESAKKYADEHGIKIFNATRGGALEIFERVDFDTLF